MRAERPVIVALVLSLVGVVPAAAEDVTFETGQSARGRVRWHRTASGGYGSYLTALYADRASGHLVVATRGVTFDPSLSTSQGFGVALAAFDASGQLQWSQPVVPGEWVSSLAPASGGGWLVAGHAPRDGSQPLRGPFHAELSPTGGLLESHELRGVVEPLAITRTADGGVAVAGEVLGAVDFGLGRRPFPLKRVPDAFALKLDASRRPVWVRVIGGPAAELVATALVAHPNGDVSIAGSLIGTESTASTGLQASGERAFVARLSSTGQLRWSAFVDGLEHGRSLALLRTDDDALIVAGRVGVDGDASAFLARIDAQGATQAVRTFSGGLVRSLALDGGQRILAGWESQLGVAASSHDPTSLAPVWARRIDGRDGAPSSVTAIAWTGEIVVLAGWTHDVVDFGAGEVTGSFLVAMSP